MDEKAMTRNMLIRFGKVLTVIQVPSSQVTIRVIEYAGYTWQIITKDQDINEIVCLDQVQETMLFTI